VTPFPIYGEQTSLETSFPSIPEWFSAATVEKICSRVLQSKRRTSCRRKPGLFAQLLRVPQCFVQSPYRSNIQQHLASWCLLIRQKPIMVTIDASLDELTGATIIITTIISTTGRSRDGDRVSASRHDPLPMDSARCPLSEAKRTLPAVDQAYLRKFAANKQGPVTTALNSATLFGVERLQACPQDFEGRASADCY
jgi:hypothetical protein